MSMSHAWQQLESHGLLHPKRTVDEVKAEGHLPETWVTYRDFIFKGERKHKTPPQQSALFIQMNTKSRREEELPLPPEAEITLDQAVSEVFTIASRESAVLDRLRVEIEEFELRRLRGTITEEQFQRAIQNLEQIRQDHAIRVDDIIHWYLDNFFRIFRDPEYYQNTHMRQLRALHQTRHLPRGRIRAEDMDFFNIVPASLRQEKEIILL